MRMQTFTHTAQRPALRRETRISYRPFANIQYGTFVYPHFARIRYLGSFLFTVPRRSPAAGTLRGLHGRRGRRRRTSPRPPCSAWRCSAGAPRPPAQRVTGAAVLRRPRGPPGAPTPATSVRWTTKFGSRQQGKAARVGTGLQYSSYIKVLHNFCFTLQSSRLSADCHDVH